MVLAKYDVPKAVLGVLERLNVQHVSILGRRGSFQAALTTNELREMMSHIRIYGPTYLTALEDNGPKLTRQQSRMHLAASAEGL